METSQNSERGPGAPLRFTEEQVVDALERTNGIYSKAARILRCHRDTVENYVERYDSCKAAAKAAKETIIDMAEDVIVGALKKKDISTARWVAGTLGSHRGWAEKREVTGPSGGPIEVKPVDYRVAVAPMLSES